MQGRAKLLNVEVTFLVPCIKDNISHAAINSIITVIPNFALAILVEKYHIINFPISFEPQA